MRPLTCNIPKPMVPVLNLPVMQRGIQLLKKHNFTDIRVLLYYQPQFIRDALGDGSRMGVKLTYVTTDTDLGTAGAVRFAQKQVDGPIVVMSGDVLTDFDLTSVVEHHRKRAAKATIVLTRMADPLEYGVVMTDEEGAITRFLEKPTWSEIFSDTINTGIYVLEPEVLDLVPEEKECDFSRHLFPLLMERGVPLHGYIASGYWRDIGNLKEYREAQIDILRGEFKTEIAGERYGLPEDNAWVGARSQVDGKVLLRNSVIGRNCRIKTGTEIVNSVLGDNCTIGEGVQIAGSILWDNVTVGDRAQLREDIVAFHSVIGRSAFLAEGVVVSDNCRIGDEAVVKAGVKLWPHKTVDDGATLSTSLVWGDKWARSLFGTYGVTGIINVEITPEFAAKLGAAYGATMAQGDVVVLSRDYHKSSRLISRALMSGVLSSGINVNNLEAVPIPVARFAVRTTGGAAGLFIRRSPYERRLTDIRFFDSAGLDISSSKEKGIDTLFFREDFRRADADRTGEISYPQRVLEYYKEGLMSIVDAGRIKGSKLKLVVDYAFGSASTIFPSVLGELGCDVVALNAYLDESKLSLTISEFQASLRRLSTIVHTLNADLGVLMDAGGEKIFLVDENGRLLSGDDSLAAMVLMGLKWGGVKTVAVPVSASQGIEVMANSYGAKVIRTRTAYRSMMEVAASGAAQMVGETKGGFIFPAFHSAMDAQCAAVKMLEYLARAGAPLSAIMKEVPPYFMVREHLPCEWELKGSIMRHLIEVTKEDRVELVDGIKVFHDGGWAVVVPDNDRPLFHINAEAQSQEAAGKLAQRYIDLIRSWQE